MLPKLFAKVWPVGIYRVVSVRRWNRAILEHPVSKRKLERTFKIGIAWVDR